MARKATILIVGDASSYLRAVKLADVATTKLAANLAKTGITGATAFSPREVEKAQKRMQKELEKTAAAANTQSKKMAAGATAGSAQQKKAVQDFVVTSREGQRFLVSSQREAAKLAAAQGGIYGPLTKAHKGFVVQAKDGARGLYNTADQAKKVARQIGGEWGLLGAQTKSVSQSMVSSTMKTASGYTAMTNAVKKTSTTMMKTPPPEHHMNMGRTVRGALAGAGAFTTLGRSIAYASASFLAFAVLSGVLRGMIAAAAQFETTLARIRGLAGGAKQQVQQFGVAMLKLAPAVAVGPNELADALYFVASAGIKANEQMQVLAVSAKASVAGLGETKVVADAVTSAINAYGAANLSAKRATDILVDTVHYGKGEAAAFAPVIGTVASFAAALGVKFNEVGASLAAMTRLGIPAQTAAIELQAVFSNMLHPTEAARKSLAKIGGLSFDGPKGLIKMLGRDGLLAVLATLKRAYRTNFEALAAAFPNIRALRGVIAILGKNAEDTFQIFRKMAGETNALAIAFGIAAKDPTTRFKAFQATMQSLQIAIGSALLPTIVKITDAIGKWMGQGDNIKNLNKNIQAVADALFQVFAAIKAVLGPFVALAGMFGKSAGWGNFFKVMLAGWLAFKIGARAARAQAAEVAAAEKAAAEGTVATTKRASLRQTAVWAQASMSRKKQFISEAYEQRKQASLVLAQERAVAKASTIPLFGGGAALRGPGGKFISEKNIEETTAKMFGGGTALRGPAGQFISKDVFTPVAMSASATSEQVVSSFQKMKASLAGIGAASSATFKSAWASLVVGARTTAVAITTTFKVAATTIAFALRGILVATGWGLFSIAIGLLAVKIMDLTGSLRRMGQNAAGSFNSMKNALDDVNASLQRTAELQKEAASRADTISSAETNVQEAKQRLAGLRAIKAISQAPPGSRAARALTDQLAAATQALAQANTDLAIAEKARAKIEEELALLDRERSASVDEQIQKYQDLTVAFLKTESQKAYLAGRAKQPLGNFDMTVLDHLIKRFEDLSKTGSELNRTVNGALFAIAATLGSKFKAQKIIPIVVRLALEKKSVNDIVRQILKIGPSTEAIRLRGHLGEREASRTVIPPKLQVGAPFVAGSSGSFALSAKLQMQQARAAAFGSAEAQERVNKAIRKWVLAWLQTKALSPEQTIEALNMLASMRVQQEKSFAIKQGLLLKEAEAAASGSKTQQLSIAKQIRDYIAGIVRAGKGGLKFLTDANQALAQYNNQIADLTKQSFEVPFDLQLAEAKASATKGEKAQAKAQRDAAARGQAWVLKQIALGKYQGDALIAAYSYLAQQRGVLAQKESKAVSEHASLLKTASGQISDAVSAARSAIGELFQGPLLNPTDRQKKMTLGLSGPQAGGLTKDLKAQVDQYQQFQNALDRLRKRGASTQLITELTAKGPEALPEVLALLKSSTPTLKAFFKQFERREKFAQKIALVQLRSEKVDLFAQSIALRLTDKQLKSFTETGRLTAEKNMRPQGKAFGGVAEGRGHGDTVPAMLTPGEVVFNKKHQAGLMKRLGIKGGPRELFNHVARFARGGVVGTPDMSGVRFADGGVADPAALRAAGVARFADLTADEKRRRIMLGLSKGKMSLAEAQKAFRFWHLRLPPVIDFGPRAERAGGAGLSQPQWTFQRLLRAGWSKKDAENATQRMFHIRSGIWGFLGRLIGGPQFTGSPRQALRETFQPFDPRTRAGLLNLATMFVPLPKGGRGVGVQFARTAQIRPGQEIFWNGRWVSVKRTAPVYERTKVGTSRETGEPKFANVFGGTRVFPERGRAFTIPKGQAHVPVRGAAAPARGPRGRSPAGEVPGRRVLAENLRVGQEIMWQGKWIPVAAVQRAVAGIRVRGEQGRPFTIPWSQPWVRVRNLAQDAAALGGGRSYRREFSQDLKKGQEVFWKGAWVPIKQISASGRGIRVNDDFTIPRGESVRVHQGTPRVAGRVAPPRGRPSPRGRGELTSTQIKAEALSLKELATGISLSLKRVEQVDPRTGQVSPRPHLEARYESLKNQQLVVQERLYQLRRALPGALKRERDESLGHKVERVVGNTKAAIDDFDSHIFGLSWIKKLVTDNKWAKLVPVAARRHGRLEPGTDVLQGRMAAELRGKLGALQKRFGLRGFRTPDGLVPLEHLRDVMSAKDAGQHVEGAISAWIGIRNRYLRNVDKKFTPQQKRELAALYRDAGKPYPEPMSGGRVPRKQQIGGENVSSPKRGQAGRRDAIPAKLKKKLEKPVITNEWRSLPDGDALWLGWQNLKIGDRVVSYVRPWLDKTGEKEITAHGEFKGFRAEGDREKKYAMVLWDKVGLTLVKEPARTLRREGGRLNPPPEKRVQVRAPSAKPRAVGPPKVRDRGMRYAWQLKEGWKFRNEETRSWANVWRLSKSKDARGRVKEIVVQTNSAKPSQKLVFSPKDRLRVRYAKGGIVQRFKTGGPAAPGSSQAARSMALLRAYESLPAEGHRFSMKDFGHLVLGLTGIDPGVVKQRLHGNFGALGAGGRPVKPGEVLGGTVLGSPLRPFKVGGLGTRLTTDLKAFVQKQSMPSKVQMQLAPGAVGAPIRDAILAEWILKAARRRKMAGGGVVGALKSIAMAPVRAAKWAMKTEHYNNLIWGAQMALRMLPKREWASGRVGAMAAFVANRNFWASKGIEYGYGGSRARLYVKMLGGSHRTDHNKILSLRALGEGDHPRISLGGPFRAAGGMVVPGKGIGDTVPALLTPGEIVFNQKHQRFLKRALQVTGGAADLFGAVDRATKGAKRFAGGGVVKPTDEQKTLGASSISGDPGTFGTTGGKSGSRIGATADVAKKARLVKLNADKVSLFANSIASQMTDSQLRNLTGLASTSFEVNVYIAGEKQTTVKTSVTQRRGGSKKR